MLEKIWEQFDHIVVLDTETTGTDSRRDEIIELAALSVTNRNGEIVTEKEFDDLIRLSEGRILPDFITTLTGISEEQLRWEGIAKAEACAHFVSLLQSPRTLVAAYNAQFDLCFLFYFMSRMKQESWLRQAKFLDILTVYKDRRPYPHKLFNAIDAYQLDSQNTHRAIDDTKAAWDVLLAMAEEQDDIYRYVNLFGFHPKYGVSPRISSIDYRPQPYGSPKKLYED